MNSNEVLLFKDAIPDFNQPSTGKLTVTKKFISTTCITAPPGRFYSQLPNRGNGHAKRDGSAIQSGNCKTGRVHGHKDHRPDAELFPGLPVLDSNRPFLQRIA